MRASDFITEQPVTTTNAQGVTTTVDKRNNRVTTKNDMGTVVKDRSGRTLSVQTPKIGGFQAKQTFRPDATPGYQQVDYETSGLSVSAKGSPETGYDQSARLKMGGMDIGTTQKYSGQKSMDIGYELAPGKKIRAKVTQSQFEDVQNAIREHVKQGIPFTECMFRAGSPAFTEFYRQVREVADKLNLDWQDQELLTTDIGECIVVEGELVPLDVPMEEIELDEADWGTRYQSDKRRLAMYNPDSDMYMGKSMPGKYKKPDPIDAADEIPADLTVDSDPDKSMNQQDLKQALAKALETLEPRETKILMMRFLDNMTLDAIGKELGVSKDRIRQILDVALRKLKHPSRSGELRGFLNNDVNEAEYRGRKVKLNSPKRGGSKKFYVYVKNPKTGRIKKISWGDTTGLSVKAKDRGAVRSFVARHKCKQANDKMTARYWSCRTPRYKALGVKGGQWW